MNKNEIIVTRQTVINSSEVVAGNGKFRFERKANGSGVVVSFGKNSLTIPNGEVGNYVLAELGAMLGSNVEVKAKRKRRSKAEMEEAKLTLGKAE